MKRRKAGALLYRKQKEGTRRREWWKETSNETQKKKTAKKKEIKEENLIKEIRDSENKTATKYERWDCKAGNRRSDFGRADHSHDVARKCPHGRTLVETAVDLLGLSHGV